MPTPSRNLAGRTIEEQAAYDKHWLRWVEHPIVLGVVALCAMSLAVYVLVTNPVEGDQNEVQNKVSVSDCG